MPVTLSHIEKTWKSFLPETPYQFTFLDENFARLYEAEERQKTLFTIFSCLAIFIACLGLFGLSAFTISQRIKEIGIRKVLGASVSGILMLLSREYIKLILIAIAISVPLAGYLVYNWLENYAYKIETQWWMYVLPGALVVGVVLLLVLGQTLKSARQNPVDNLRYE